MLMFFAGFVVGGIVGVFMVSLFSDPMETDGNYMDGDYEAARSEQEKKTDPQTAVSESRWPK